MVQRYLGKIKIIFLITTWTTVLSTTTISFMGRNADLIKLPYSSL